MDDEHVFEIVLDGYRNARYRDPDVFEAYVKGILISGGQINE